MNAFLIALGANLPIGERSPTDTLQSALTALSARNVLVDRVSRFYRTPCFPPGAGPDYVNAAARVRADITPEEMLKILHGVEADFGRERVVRWGTRTLDLDLIAAENTVRPDLQTFTRWHDLSPQDQQTKTPDTLIVPHPRLQDRAFVLVPMRDIAADWVHPVLNRSVAEMCDALSPDALAEVVAL